MNRLARLVGEIGYDDLLRLRKDIVSGNMLRLVEERIAAQENPNLVCPVCGAGVRREEGVSITFGPAGLRQRATFDGEDCLRHFIDRKA